LGTTAAARRGAATGTATTRAACTGGTTTATASTASTPPLGRAGAVGRRGRAAVARGDLGRGCRGGAGVTDPGLRGRGFGTGRPRFPRGARRVFDLGFFHRDVGDVVGRHPSVGGGGGVVVTEVVVVELVVIRIVITAGRAR
jgi:hypothetical protein